MGWLAERVWQLGLAIVLAFAGAALVYVGAADDASVLRDPVAVIGLALFFVALAIPLASKVWQAVDELDLDV